MGFKIKELHIMESQKSMKPGLYSKGIRLDIYAKDEQGNAYDIEMQLLDTGELDLRSRYYHSEMDRHQIQVGQKYSELQESIVIFVCNFDMFKRIEVFTHLRHYVWRIQRYIYRTRERQYLLT